MNNGTRVLATKALEDEHAATRDRARREMFDLLTSQPEPAATKSVWPVTQRSAEGCQRTPQ